jgi:hypothetical protein
MLKIPDAYQKAVKVKIIEALECTCQRCGPEPKIWPAKEIKFNEDGTLQLPTLCPRCHSSRWWEPVSRPGTATGQRKRHADERQKKSSQPKS